MKRVEEIGGRTPRVEFSDGSKVIISKAAAMAIGPCLMEPVGIEFILPDGRRIPADLAEGQAPTPAAGAVESVTWIVSEPSSEGGGGEFGVEVNGRAFFYYKWPNTGPSETVKYRSIHKREFGEVIRRPGTAKAETPAERQAPRIDLQEGDPVTWAASGKGKVLRLFEGIGLRLVAEVQIAGWFFDQQNACYTTTDTGIAATMEVLAADLKRGAP